MKIFFLSVIPQIEKNFFPDFHEKIQISYFWVFSRNFFHFKSSYDSCSFNINETPKKFFSLILTAIRQFRIFLKTIFLQTWCWQWNILSSFFSFETLSPFMRQWTSNSVFGPLQKNGHWAEGNIISQNFADSQKAKPHSLFILWLLWYIFP